MLSAFGMEVIQLSRQRHGVKTVQSLAILVVSSMAFGCGTPPSDVPKEKLHPFMGIVSVDGAPAKGVHVVLHPAGNHDASIVTPNGITDESGVFKVTTYSVADGAPEGSYQLSFSWPEPVSPGAGDSDDVIEKLPQQYQFAESSGVSLEVNPKTPEMPLFELSTL
jgi:hypothetical protein